MADIKNVVIKSCSKIEIDVDLDGYLLIHQVDDVDGSEHTICFPVEYSERVASEIARAANAFIKG